MSQLITDGMVDAALLAQARAACEGEFGANARDGMRAVLGAAVRHALADGRAALPMVLHCPACGMQHIDGPEYADAPPGSTFDGSGVAAWPNPPHRTHQCQHCTDDQGRPFQWRPSFVPTVGVANLDEFPAPSGYVSDLAATRAKQWPTLRPADCTVPQWGLAVRKVFTAARGDKFLEGIPSHWLEAMRDALLSVGRP